MSMDDFSIKEEIDANNKRIALLEEQNRVLIDEIKNLREELSKKEEPLKDELMRKFNRNKKNIIKSKILDIIGGSRAISIPEVKDIVVEQMRYCSKASFYRYIEEMKRNGLLEFSNINNREVVVLSRQI
jgi:restriction endonuclease S subunit